MINREALAAIGMACLLALALSALVILQFGCMSSRGVEEMSVAVPALFQFDMEFQDDAPTSLSVGPATWWESLLETPENLVVPVDE